MDNITLEPSQLAVGEDILNRLLVYINNVYNLSITYSKSIISAVRSEKIDLTSIFESEVSKIKDDVDSLILEVNILDNLAQEEYNLISDYSSGKLASQREIYDAFPSTESYVAAKAASMIAFAYPNTASRVFQTIGLGGYKFGEGFTKFFEDVGDAAISSAGAVFKAINNDDYAYALKDLKDFELAKLIWEENDVFNKLNRNSFFDKNSTYATSMFDIGKATGAVLTIEGIKYGFGDVGARAFELYDDIGEFSSNFLDHSNTFSNSGLSSSAASLNAFKLSVADMLINKTFAYGDDMANSLEIPLQEANETFLDSVMEEFNDRSGASTIISEGFTSLVDEHVENTIGDNSDGTI